MSAFNLHSAIAISPSIQAHTWQSVPSDQQSKTSEQSVGTIQRASNYRPSSGSTRSLGSSSSARLQIENENLAARRNASYSSVMLSPYTASSPLVKRTSKQASHRSSCGNEISPALNELRVSSLLAEVGPLEDIDLNAGCGESLYSKHEAGQGVGSHPVRGLSFDIRKQETLSTPRLPSSGSREVTSPRSFNMGTEHPAKYENPLKRLIGTFRTQGPQRRHSLTVRKERWILDDFDEVKPTEVNLQQSRRTNRHQKASSWSSSGIRNAIKSATVRLQSVTSRPHSPVFSRARILKSNRGSRNSIAGSRISMEADQAAARAKEHAARDRAVQRRRILEELISSEESYVADLKVLLHVGGQSHSTSRSPMADTTLKIYFFMLDSAPRGPQATQPEISQNVAGMLRLHEDILLEMKTVMPDSHIYSEAAAQQQSRHPRWYSVESAEAPSIEVPVRKARPAKDFSWLGIQRNRTLITTPGEAADVARIFERMVRKINAKRLQQRTRLIRSVNS